MNTAVGTVGDRRVWLAIRAVRAAALPLLLWMVWASPPASATLTHRFTFNDGTAADSVGIADGTILGNAFVDGDGLLQLPGGSNDYVGLNGPAINIALYTDVTFEAWFTVDQLLTWERVFDFGDRTVPAGDQGYVYYTPQGGGGGGLGVYATFGNRTEAPHGVLQTDHLYHLAMVIDDNANGGSDALSVYLDGNLQTSVGHSKSLSDVGNTFAYLGESLVTGDPNFNGSMDEFRIYDHAMNLTDVQNSFAAGPTPTATLRLEVETVTGSVTIVGDPFASVTFDYYTIASAGGALDTAGWLSLDDQDLDAIGPDPGESWDESLASDSSQLYELFLLGASTADVGERMDLGHAFNTSISGQGVNGDLTFSFSRQGSQSLSVGEVVYVTPGPLDGDYNGDLMVNAADYPVWRNTLGSQIDLTADGDGDGKIDIDDYIIWKWTYGNTLGTGTADASTVSAPEPAAATLVLLALAGAAAIFRRR